MIACPRCHLLLDPVAGHETQILRCRGCGGAWVESRATDPTSVALLLAALAGPAMAAAPAGPGRPACPRCVLCDLSPRGGPSTGQSCAACGGLWLDAADLAALGGSRDVTGAASTSQDTPSERTTDDRATPHSYTPPSRTVPVSQPPPTQSVAPAPTHADGPTERALRALLEGNERFAAGRPEHPRQDVRRRREVLVGQRPIAVVVGCSDSRVPPEIIFDHGIGDLFVVRSAGEAIGRRNENSIKLAIEMWDVPLVLVLGHSSCSAVRAGAEQETAHVCLTDIEGSIEPALAAPQDPSGDIVDSAARARVQRIVNALRAMEPVIAPRCRERRLSVVGAFYDLETGSVSLVRDASDLGQHSTTAELQPGRSAPATAVTTLRGPLVGSDAGASLPAPPPLQVEPSGDVGDPIRRAAVLAEPGAAPVPGASPILPDTPAGSSPFAPPWETGQQRSSARWCSRCRTEEPVGDTYCSRCGSALVESSLVVRCLGCQAENPISALRCIACAQSLRHLATGADLVPPAARWPRVQRGHRARSPGASCGAEALAVALAIAGLAALAAAASAHLLP